jgi:hypothetical protein
MMKMMMMMMMMDDDGVVEREEKEQNGTEQNGKEKKREEKKLLLAKAVRAPPSPRPRSLVSGPKLLHCIAIAIAILASQGEAGELNKGEGGRGGSPEAQSPKSNIPFEPPGEISDAARKRTTNGRTTRSFTCLFVRVGGGGKAAGRWRGRA